jgi:cell division protein ZipA
MTELRWVLLALGVLLILGVYLWSRGIPQRWLVPMTGLPKTRSRHKRVEPGLGADDLDEPVELVEIVDEERVRADPATERSSNSPPAPERIVTIRFIPNAREIACDRVILAMRAAGLKHGRYGIFHRHSDALSDEPLFSVASLTEPGSFDLSRLADTKIPGMSFFMVLPGAGDPVERFDQMVATAKELARKLDGELRDEKGSSWSIQRERYVREEIIEYRRLQDRPHPGRLS